MQINMQIPTLGYFDGTFNMAFIGDPAELHGDGSNSVTINGGWIHFFDWTLKVFKKQSWVENCISVLS